MVSQCCCVPFGRMVNEGGDSFCCCRWYRQDIVSDDRLRFCGVVSIEAVLTCIVEWGKCMRPCIASRSTLLFPIKCNPIIGPVNFFITTKCSTNTLSRLSNLSVVVANGFLTGHWLLVSENWEDSRF